MGEGTTRRSRLSARVEDVLAEDKRPEPELLDELLTECAAEALSLRARILRQSRRREDLLGDRQLDEGGEEEAHFILGSNEQAWEEWRELSGLIDELRARRRGLQSEPASGSGAQFGAR